MMYIDDLPWGTPHFLWRAVIYYITRTRLYKLATPMVLSVMSILFANRRLGICFNLSYVHYVSTVVIELMG